MSIGETLADARRQSGLTIAQVSQRTRIRESIVRAVEQNDFSPCGGDFYARGHIRSIADVVGTDPAPLIREYDSEHHPSGITAAEAFSPTTPIKIREPRRRRFPVGILAVVAVLAVIGYFSYRLVNSHSDSTAAPAATAAPAVTSTPTASPTPSPTPSPTVTHKPAKPEAVIVLTASQDCWVNLTYTNGKQVYQGTIAAGTSKTWREVRKISMVIGNPPGARLKVDGKIVKPNTAQVVTLDIDPYSTKNPVSLAAPAGATLTTTST